MRKSQLLPICILLCCAVQAQKKVLDHSVYDGWQSIGESSISNNGQWVVYAVTPQQGDGELVIQSVDGSYKKVIPRGYRDSITEDSRFVVFKIKPPYQQTRQARIKKKRPDELPKDSIGILELGKDEIFKRARVKDYRVPDEAGGWVAYHMERALPDTSARADTSRSGRRNPTIDSLQRVIDSLNNKINTGAQKKVVDGLYGEDADEDDAPGGERAEEVSDLLLRNLATGKEKLFRNVTEYYFSKNGKVLVFEIAKDRRDPRSRSGVVWYNLAADKADTIAHNGNDFKNFILDETGDQLVFLAERDSSAKSLRKYYKLWYYKPGMDTAVMKIDGKTAGLGSGLVVSGDAIPFFSKDGKKLFFGTAPVLKVRDTTLVDFETARLDVWHYNDDYLQSQQLKQLNRELKRSYLAVVYTDGWNVVQLGTPQLEDVVPAGERNSDIALGTTNKPFRKEGQWLGRTPESAYVINMKDGSRKLVKEKLSGNFNISPNGKYILWYDLPQRAYFSYNVETGETKNITAKIKVPLYDEEDDQPDFPPAHGMMGWQSDDQWVYVYDKYDIWKLDPLSKADPVCITGGLGRKTKCVYRNAVVQFRREMRTLKPGQLLMLTIFNTVNKGKGHIAYKLGDPFVTDEKENRTFPQDEDGFKKAKNASIYVYLKSSFHTSPNITVFAVDSSTAGVAFTRYMAKEGRQLSNINPQQKDYNWFTAELYRWKMFDGRMAEGLLYKPEDFDPKKKYPVIFYFYEKDADNLYNYIAPAPTPSRLNIPYFTSNGYIVFDPNIYYKVGQPGEDAYNSVVSAARNLAKMPWVDSAHMALQGQSWGGYQIGYLITRTNLFAAAYAGAPVANMTSAYGGIRWETGVTRQFQYEKTQSRIGATLWQHPERYIKNSPLFKVDKINTPLLIMANDADGAVPWWQGIEFFTALRRFGKKVWLLQYNGEAHNLVERRNRLDLSIREAQFFDHFLKGAKPAKWLVSGVPAIDKGKDWGLSEP